jgi:hypothetical protein
MKGLYAIHDKVAKAAAGPLMTFQHDAVATRSFMDIAGDQKSSLHAHLEDYDLVCVGEFDDEGLVVHGLDSPRVVVSGEAVKAMAAHQHKLALEA